MKEETLEYNDQAYLLEGYAAYETIEPKPVVIIFHAFRGRDNFVDEMARKLAKLGYLGFAADVYGKGIHTEDKEEASKLMMPFVENRDVLRQRVVAAFKAIQEHPVADSKRIATIGFCFGGLCALDLARAGVDVKAAVSFHGLLQGLPHPMKNEAKSVKVLACHGYQDPLVSGEQVDSFKKEWSTVNVDWQLHVYGQALHAFTVPSANDHDFGTVYNQAAAKRSLTNMEHLLKEVF